MRFTASTMEYGLNEYIAKNYRFQMQCAAKHDVSTIAFSKAHPRVFYYFINDNQQHLWCFKRGEDLQTYIHFCAERL